MSEIKVLKEDEKIFDLEVDLGNLKKSEIEKVKRIKIKLNDDLYFKFSIDFDGAIIVNKQDYIGDRAISIEPRYSNEIKIS